MYTCCRPHCGKRLQMWLDRGCSLEEFASKGYSFTKEGYKIHCSSGMQAEAKRVCRCRKMLDK